MAGDWLPIRSGLAEEPKLLTMSDLLQLDPDTVVGKLVRVWGWASETTADGRVPGGKGAWIDRKAGVTGFADAMKAAGWLTENKSGLTFPDFNTYISVTAKERLMSARRQMASRANRDKNQPAVTATSRDERDNHATPVTETSRGDRDLNKNEILNTSHSPSENGPPSAPEPDISADRTAPESDPSSKPPRKPPDSAHHAAVAAFCDRWRDRYGGVKYPFNAGKDGAAVKWCLAQLGGDLRRWGEVVDAFLANVEPFVTDQRHPLSLLRSQLTRYVAPELPSHGRHPGRLPPADRRAAFEFDPAVHGAAERIDPV